MSDDEILTWTKRPYKKRLSKLSKILEILRIFEQFKLKKIQKLIYDVKG